MDIDKNAWSRRFAARGWPDAGPLAAGMEGTVFGLDRETIGKVWERRGVAELAGVGAFYEDLAAAELEFATPRFLEVWEEDGVAVTIEPRLPGVPLDEVLPLDRPIRPEAIDCMLDVLAGLRAAGAVAGGRVLPVLEEPEAMWAGARSWSDAFGKLLERRLAVSGELLAATVPNFERAAARLLELTAALEVEEPTALHGDLIPANVLVDGDLRPVAVLDFGFFTTLGDPLFDLAVTASVYDMYGPRARETEAAFDAAASARGLVPPERLALYRAAYAVATATVYDRAGEDGHFRWCARMLGRPEVAALLGTGDAG
jgi:hypothetical protein